MRPRLVVGQIRALDSHQPAEVFDAALNEPVRKISKFAAGAVVEGRLIVSDLLVMESRRLGVDVELAHLDMNMPVQPLK